MGLSWSYVGMFWVRRVFLSRFIVMRLPFFLSLSWEREQGGNSMGLILDARSPSLFLKVVAYGKAGTRYQWIGHYTLTLSSLKEWPG